MRKPSLSLPAPRLRWLLLASAIVFIAGSADAWIPRFTFSLGNTAQALSEEHERLRVKNTFKTPEEVVRYYCARDASGFVWSGLLDAERRAFTLWNQIPEHDSFYVAKRYEIQPAVISRQSPDRAIVEVRYQILAVGDAHGTRMPVNFDPDYRVQFSLKKVGGAWKIEKPGPTDISPVVLQAKFPLMTAQR